MGGRTPSRTPRAGRKRDYRPTQGVRSAIRMADGEPFAVVHENWPLRIKQVDLSGLPAATAWGGSGTFADRRTAASLSPRMAEPGIRATLLRLGPTEHVFILMMHHLVCDAHGRECCRESCRHCTDFVPQRETPALTPFPSSMAIMRHRQTSKWRQQVPKPGAWSKKCTAPRSSWSCQQKACVPPRIPTAAPAKHFREAPSQKLCAISVDGKRHSVHSTYRRA